MHHFNLFLSGDHSSLQSMLCQSIPRPESWLEGVQIFHFLCDVWICSMSCFSTGWRWEKNCPTWTAPAVAFRTDYHFLKHWQYHPPLIRMNLSTFGFNHMSASGNLTNQKVNRATTQVAEFIALRTLSTSSQPTGLNSAQITNPNHATSSTGLHSHSSSWNKSQWFYLKGTSYIPYNSKKLGIYLISLHG